MLSVDVDNTVTYVINQQAAGSRTDNYVTAGNLRLLIVGVIAMTADPTGVTYGGVALTKLAAVSSPGSTYQTRASLWALEDPAVGTNGLRINYSGTWSARIIVRSYVNVHAYTPLGTPQSYSGNTVSTGFTFPNSQNQGYSFHVGGFGGNATRTIAAGETTLFNNADTYGAQVISGMCAEKASVSTYAGLTFSSNLARDFAHVGVAMRPFPGGRTFQIVNNV